MTNDALAPRKYQNVFLVAIILFLCATAVTMMQYKIPTIMTAIMEQLNVSSSTAAWFMSIFTFIGIFFGLPIGALMKKIGPRKLIIGALTLDIVASVIGGFAPGMGAAAVPAVLVTRALEGIAFVSVIASGPVVIQACVDPKRVGTASGIWMLGGNLGATFAGVLTPTLYFAIGFAGLWIAYAAITLVCLLLFIFGIKMPKAPAGDAAEAAEEKEGYSFFFKPKVFLFFLAFCIFQILLLTVLAFAPTALQQRGMAPTMSGLVSTLPALMAIFSSIAFGAIADKIHRCKPLFIIGMLAMTITAPIMLNASGAPMWIALVVMGLLAMGVPAVAISAYPEILGDPKRLTIGMGVLMIIQSIGQFLGSQVPSLLLGPALTNWMLCGIVLLVLGVVATVSLIACKFK